MDTNAMQETLPTHMVFEGVEYEIDCWYNYMGEARVGIAPVGALDEPVRPGSEVHIRNVPLRAREVYVAAFAIDFSSRTASHLDIGNGTEPNNALLSAFVATVFHEQNETLTITPFEPRPHVPDLGEMLLQARTDHAAAGYPVGSHLEYLGADYDDL